MYQHVDLQFMMNLWLPNASKSSQLFIKYHTKFYTFPNNDISHCSAPQIFPARICMILILHYCNLCYYCDSLQLDDLRELVRNPLSKMERSILSALIVIEVHARDVIANMIDENVQNVNDFEWISQLRYGLWNILILWNQFVRRHDLWGICSIVVTPGTIGRMTSSTSELWMQSSRTALSISVTLAALSSLHSLTGTGSNLSV